MDIFRKSEIVSIDRKEAGKAVPLVGKCVFCHKLFE